PLRPRRDAPFLLLSGFSIELEARIWFAAPQHRDLREMKQDPALQAKSTLGLGNLPKHLVGAILTFPYAGPIFQEPYWKKKAANCRAELSQVRVLAAFGR